MFSIFRPYIFSLDPEAAHDLAIKGLKFNLIPKSFFETPNEHLLETKIFGRTFKNPIGLAAGFDKSAEVYNSLFKFGFGFIEIGTITPKKQFGNAKPRVFRLESDKALINRLGFNNDGLEIISNRIKNNKPTRILGANIGPNKSSQNKSDDFITCLKSIHTHADYITINISSPNTEGLRDFHEKEILAELLRKINQTCNKMQIDKPILFKISPDINDTDLSHIIELILKFKIQGLVISNSTDKNKDTLTDENKHEVGGLTGQPLKNISTNLIKKFYKELRGKVKIIGVGGVDSGESAFEKITAGANLVQLYTGLIYKGPGIVKNIKTDMIKILKSENINNIEEAVGINS